MGTASPDGEQMGMRRSGLGAYIREQRLALGLTQRELAEAIRATDRTYVTSLEAGRIGLPQGAMRKKIARALHVREVDLLIAAGLLAPDTSTAAEPMDPRLVALIPALQALSDANLHVVATLIQEILKAQNRPDERVSPSTKFALA